MHKLLSRQLKRLAKDRAGSIPAEFLAVVNEAYQQADEDRLLLERAMELTSEELLERNEELDRSLSLLQATLESTGDGLLVIGAEGQIRSYNQRFVEIWQLPPEILATNDRRAFLRQAQASVVDAEAFARRLEDLQGNIESESFDVLKFKDGKIIERYSRPVRHEGAIRGRVWSFRDVTEHQRLEEQIRQSQKLEAVGRLAGGISHDFNNLLTVITGCCDLARHRDGDNDLMALIAEIDLASRRASELTSQLLAFSRQEVVEPEVLDVCEVVAGLSELLHRLLGVDLKLVTHFEVPSATILADKSRLEQVVMNLVINARDSIQRSGEIEIRVQEVVVEAGEEPFPMAITKPGVYVALRVKDDGEGIAPEIRERIFEPFFTTKDAGKGTGLGLSTVYGIVRKFDGALDLVSEVGKGTEFRLTFPKVAGRPREAPTVEETSVVGPATVLVVEDDPSVRLILEAILDLLDDLIVHVAASPQEALDLVGEGSEAMALDLLISDIVMPDMDGFELAERLKTLYPQLRVLFVSGYDPDSAERGRGPKLQAGFLSKPFNFKVLGEKIQEVLTTPVDVRPADGVGQGSPLQPSRAAQPSSNGKNGSSPSRDSTSAAASISRSSKVKK